MIIEPEESAVARERSEEEARQQQKRDLVAQERMASAAESMNIANWLSAGFVLIGTGLLAWTLRLTRKTIVATEKVGEQQSRAYVYVSGGKFAAHESGIYCTVTIANAGYSSAIVTKVTATLESGTHLYQDPDATPQHDSRANLPSAGEIKYLLPPSQPLNHLMHWEESELVKSIRGMAKATDLCDAAIWGRIEWTNVATGKNFIETFSLSALNPADFFTKDSEDRFTTALYVHQIEKVNAPQD